jgi:hypothetical protein
MPRYRDRTVPSRTSSPGPLSQSLLDVTFTDGYQPTVNDPDIVAVYQGTVRTAAMNEVGYFRATWAPGHNSDALFRAIATASATGNAFELEDVTRTKRPFGVDPQTGAIKRWDQQTASLLTVGPTDTRHADLPAGVAFLPSSQFGMVGPEIYGVRMMTVDPSLTGTDLRTITSQELCAVRVFCHADCTITTMSSRIRTSTAVGAAGYNGYAIYSDGSTMNILGSTPDDTTLFETTGQKAKNLSTPVPMVAGNFYWFCMLSNFSSGAATWAAAKSTGEPGVTNSWPAGNTSATVAAQTSFPATITKASMVGNGARPVIAGY